MLSRIRLYLKYGLIRMYARIRGAYIGRNSIITWKLACRANKNLVIGNDCIVESWNIDLRSKVEICDNVIINRDVVIIRVSHYIDNDKSFTTRFYPDLKIEMYCWLCTGCIILPSVNTIAEGSVVGAYSNMQLTFTATKKESVKRVVNQIKEDCIELYSYELRDRRTSQGEIFEASIEMKVKRGNHNERLINYMDEFDDVTISSIE